MTVSFWGPIKRPWSEQSRVIEVEPGLSVGELLGSLGYSEDERAKVAVTVNGSKSGQSRELDPDDEVRVILMAGGG